MSKKPDPDALAALDTWADQVAALEGAVSAGVARWAADLAADRRLAKDDRDFAQAQADAIRRALRRAKTKPPAPAKGRRKPKRNS